MLDRHVIRLATVAVLKAAATAAGDRVYPTQIIPWRRDMPLPAIGVYTLDEAGEGIDGGIVGAFQFRYALKLAIDVVVAAGGAQDLEPAARLMVDSQVPFDALCEQITLALLPNPAWYRLRLNGHTCAMFQGVERWDTTGVLGRVEETDRRSMGGTINAVLTYGRNYDPIITDAFCRLHFDVDVIDPAADPNIKYPGPDGRIEVEFMVPRTKVTGGPVDEVLCDEALVRTGVTSGPAKRTKVIGGPIDLDGLVPTGAAWTSDPDKEE